MSETSLVPVEEKPEERVEIPAPNRDIEKTPEQIRASLTRVFLNSFHAKLEHIQNGKPIEYPDADVALDEESLQSSDFYEQIAEDLNPGIFSKPLKKAIAEKAMQELKNIREEMISNSNDTDVVELAPVNLVTIKQLVSLINTESLTITEPKQLPYAFSEVILNYRHVKDETAQLSFYKIDNFTRYAFDASLRDLATTTMAVYRTDELVDKDWYVCKVETSAGPSVEVYFSENTFENPENTVAAIQALAQVHEDMIVNMGNKGASVKHIILPDDSYIPRYFYTPDYHGAIYYSADVFGKHGIASLAHEETHAILDATIGANFSALLTEGAALYFEEREFPGSPYMGAVRMNLLPGVLTDITRQRNSQEISFAHNSVGFRDYESRYPYGYLFVSYFCETYGEEAFLKLYKYTSTAQKNLWHPMSGVQLVREGYVLGSEEDIITAGLCAVGISAEDFKKGLQNHARSMPTKEEVRRIY